MYSAEQLVRQGRIREERPAGTGVDRADPTADPKSLASGRLITADNRYGAGAHVLFLADDLRDSLLSVVGEGFRRVFEQAREDARLRGGHGRRQVDWPVRIDGEAAHHLQRRRGVFLWDGDVPEQEGLDDALADDGA